MANTLSASDVVVGSAGATSLSEITAMGKASIIIPKAYTAEIIKNIMLRVCLTMVLEFVY